MLNEEKIKVMNQLAMYEKNEGRKYLPISKYYRSDYIGLALIKNFFLVTIGYALILAGLAAYFGEYLLDHINSIHPLNLGIGVIVGYVAVLAVYTVLTYIQHAVNYHRAKKSVKTYYVQLTKLSKMYEREERKTTGRSPAGGYKR